MKALPSTLPKLTKIHVLTSTSLLGDDVIVSMVDTRADVSINSESLCDKLGTKEVSRHDISVN